MDSYGLKVSFGGTWPCLSCINGTVLKDCIIVEAYYNCCQVVFSIREIGLVDIWLLHFGPVVHILLPSALAEQKRQY